MRPLVGRWIEKRERGQPHQVAIAVLIHRQQNQPRQFPRRPADRAQALILIAKIDRERTADNRLNAGASHLVGEFQRTEHVVGVGQRERGLAVVFGELRELRDRQRAFQQRIGGVDMQMDEFRVGDEFGPRRTLQPRRVIPKTFLNCPDPPRRPRRCRDYLCANPACRSASRNCGARRRLSTLITGRCVSTHNLHTGR